MLHHSAEAITALEQVENLLRLAQDTQGANTTRMLRDAIVGGARYMLPNHGRMHADRSQYPVCFEDLRLPDPITVVEYVLLPDSNKQVAGSSPAPRKCLSVLFDISNVEARMFLRDRLPGPQVEQILALRDGLLNWPIKSASGPAPVPPGFPAAISELEWSPLWFGVLQSKLQPASWLVGRYTPPQPASVFSYDPMRLAMLGYDAESAQRTFASTTVLLGGFAGRLKHALQINGLLLREAARESLHECLAAFDLAAVMNCKNVRIHGPEADSRGARGRRRKTLPYHRLMTDTNHPVGAGVVTTSDEPTLQQQRVWLSLEAAA